MNANAELLYGPGFTESAAQEIPLPRTPGSPESADWNPEVFAREQIRSLVRRVFFASGTRPVRQVVICGTERHSPVAKICDQVGRALALETKADIAVVVRDCANLGISAVHNGCLKSREIKSWATQASNNLWRVPEWTMRLQWEEAGTGPYWLSRLAELRRGFEYAVIEGPAAGISSEAGLVGQLADGLILVLDAGSTRKATARKIKEVLEGVQARILGTVLNERKFPVPERIYRRL